MLFRRLSHVACFVVAAFVLSFVVACGPEDSDTVSDASSDSSGQIIQTNPPRTYDLAPTDDLQSIAEAAYIYSFPLLEWVRITPNFIGSGINKLTRREYLLSVSNQGTATAPNNDTLYASSLLDVRAEPMVVDVPVMNGNRYYSFNFMDGYAHIVSVLGSRTIGWGGGRILVVSPDWNGTVPPSVTNVVRAETPLVLMLVRTAVYGQADLDAAVAVQKQYQIYPLSQLTGGNAPTVEALTWPTIDLSYPANFKMTMMGDLSVTGKELSEDFITYANFALGKHVPVSSEQGLMAKFAKIGLGPDLIFDKSAIPADTLNAIKAGVASARTIIAQGEEDIPQVNGWEMLLGYIGDRQAIEGNYIKQAVGQLTIPWGNKDEEAVYYSTAVDSTGATLDASSGKYTLTFPADQLPPNDNGFWSLTMYNKDRYFIGNPINRYSIGSLAHVYTVSPDGSLTIFLQADDPGGSDTSNWLPAPQAQFTVTLRIYCPDDSVLYKTWTPPAVVKVP